MFLFFTTYTPPVPYQIFHFLTFPSMKLTWVLAFAASLGWQGVNAATKVYNFTISSKTIAPGMQYNNFAMTKVSYFTSE